MLKIRGNLLPLQSALVSVVFGAQWWCFCGWFPDGSVCVHRWEQPHSEFSICWSPNLDREVSRKKENHHSPCVLFLSPWTGCLLPKPELFYAPKHSPELQTLKRDLPKRDLPTNSCPGGCQQLSSWGSQQLVDSKVTTASGICVNFLVEASLEDRDPWSFYQMVALYPIRLHHSWRGVRLLTPAAWVKEIAVTHSSLVILGKLHELMPLCISLTKVN